MITSEVMRVTPPLAERWLRKNIVNRPLSKNWVANLAQRMIDGDWALNGSSIVFDENGLLSDGQHRLSAVASSGVTIETIVTRGVKKDAFETIDEGKKRGIADALSITGEKNTAVLSALLRMIYVYEKYGELKHVGRTITNKNGIALLERHPEAREAAAKGRYYRGIFSAITPATGAFGYWLLSQVDKEDADMFFEKLVSGVGLEKGSPILLLRDKMIFNAAARSSINNAEWARFVIKCWNYWRKGKVFKGRSIPMMKDEKFPVPV